MPSLSQSAVHLHNIPTFLSTATINTFQVTDQATDFQNRLDGLIITYITNKWTLPDPPTPIGDSAPTLQNRDINIGNYDYDKFRTYYIRVKELPARIVNRVRDNLTDFEAPIEFECSARRLTRGEGFQQLNAIIFELIRIFLLYQRLDIFGVQAVSFDSLSPLGIQETRTRHSAEKTVWRRTLRILLHYKKVSLLR